MKSPALIKKWNFVFKSTGRVGALIIEVISAIYWNRHHFSRSSLGLSGLNFFRISHFGFTDWAWVFGCNFIETISNFSSIFKNPAHAINPILKAVDPSNNFCNKTNANGFHTTPSGLWGSVVGVFSAPSRHFLNHTILGVAR